MGLGRILRGPCSPKGVEDLEQALGSGRGLGGQGKGWGMSSRGLGPSKPGRVFICWSCVHMLVVRLVVCGRAVVRWLCVF